MKRALSFSTVAMMALALCVTSTAASAQPYGPPPGGGYGPGYGPPPEPPPRRLAFGGGLGLGVMENKYDDLACDDCDYEPLAGAVNAYVGFFLSPQLMLGIEGDWTGQRLDAIGSNYLLQSSAIITAKLWLNPQLWVKGGLGWGGLSILYDDFYGTVADDFASGGAVMLGVGYEFFDAQNFTIDGNFKFIGAGYDSLDDEIYTGTFNLGFNWYL